MKPFLAVILVLTLCSCEDKKKNEYNIRLVHEQVEDKIRAKDYTSAISYCDSILGINPGERIVYELKGEIHYQTLNFSDAIPCFTKSLDLIKHEEKSYKKFELIRKRAYCYKRIGEIDSAIMDYELSIETSDSNWRSVSYYCLGKIYLEEHDTNKACEHLSKAIRFHKAKWLNELYCK